MVLFASGKTFANTNCGGVDNFDSTVLYVLECRGVLYLILHLYSDLNPK